jgi:hypothetical protein
MHWNSQVLFWNETLHVSDSSFVHHQENLTVYTAMLYAFGQDHPEPARKLSTNPVWHKPLLCVRWETPDDGQRNFLKHGEFHFKTKLEKFSASSWFYYKDIKLCTTVLYICIFIIILSFEHNGKSHLKIINM